MEEARMLKHDPEKGSKRLNATRWIPKACAVGVKGIHRIWVLVTLIITIAGLAGSPSLANSQVKYTEVRDTLPVRETQYLIRVPDNWNGTLISDLDYHLKADTPHYLYLLDHGYALSGTRRHADRDYNYDPAREIHDLVSVLDIFESKFGKPKRTIQYGVSGGGKVAVIMGENHPDRIDGVIAGDATTTIWTMNTYLDGFFVLKALLAPDLPIVNLPTDESERVPISTAWQQVINNAQQTPEGRARIALAVTIGQWPAWGGPGTAPGQKGPLVPEPDPSDVYAVQKSMYHSVFIVLPGKDWHGPTMLELCAGPISWNTHVDYKEFYKNGDVFYRKAVEILYRDADLSLEADLDKINAFPRIAADASAIKWWSAPARTTVCEPKVPLLRLQSTGDDLVFPSMTEGYEAVVAAKGYAELFRKAYVHRWGHWVYSVAEVAAAVETMMQRLDTGVWPSTDPEALNKLGMSLDPTSTSRFCDFKGVEKYNRIWVPTVTDYLGQFNSEKAHRCFESHKDRSDSK